MDNVAENRNFEKLVRHSAHLKRIYVLSLLLLGVMLVANYWIIQFIVSAHTKTINLTHLVADQGANFHLATQTVDITIQLQQRGAINKRLREKSKLKLESIHDKILDNQKAISKLTEELSTGFLLFGAESDLREPMSRLENDTQVLTEKLHNLIETDPELIDWRFSLWSPLYLSLSPDGKLNRSITEASESMFRVLDENASRLNLAHAVILTVTFAILILEALLIFRPMFRRLYLDQDMAAEEHNKVVYLATHDYLTELGNRRHFSNRIIAKNAQLLPRRFAIMLVDLDHFKIVNDIHGSLAGDYVLKTVADRIVEWCAEGWEAFRLAGDEFAIYISDGYTEPELLARADELLETIGKPVFFDGNVLIVNASVGIAPSTERVPFSCEQLLIHADIALRAAKSERRNGAVVFGDKDSVRRAKLFDLADRVLDAFDRGDIRPHYQPVVDVRTGRIVGVEALLRWNTESGDIVDPSTFLPVIEECGATKRATEQLLKFVSSDRDACIAAGVDPGYISVNIPDSVLIDQGMPRQFEQLLGETGYEWLQIEIIETAILHRSAEVIRNNLTQFAAHGASIALDDFGTGYASLSHFREFPCDVVKIDRSFVDDMLHDDGARLIVKGLVELSIGLGKRIIVEGVERAEQERMLREWGVFFVQGFLYGRPMPLSKLIARLSDGDSGAANHGKKPGPRKPVKRRSRSNNNNGTRRGG